MATESSTAYIWIGISIVVAIAIVAALVMMRTYTDGKSQVTLADAGIALIPIIIALFATGKIEKLGIGPSGITVETAIVKAADAGVSSQVDVLGDLAEIDPVLTGMKGGENLIPRYLEQGKQGLTFRIGGSYVGQVMRDYFLQLTQSPRFKYFIVVEPNDDRFFGMMDARQLISLVEHGAIDWNQLERLIESKPLELAQLPGFVRLDGAVRESVTKREALAKLEETNLDWLPVVNEDNKFVGVVDRSKVTASLILDITNTLSKRPTE